ncbi:MAG: hypothetical protein MSQ14_00680 [[Pasteurella] aerogenes]|nr:hypothetical protein [[Pasteurella] aerogenes]
MFELAAQASFKFSVKEMVTKRREKVKTGCLSFGYFSLAKQRKVTKWSAPLINKKSS